MGTDTIQEMIRFGEDSVLEFKAVSIPGKRVVAPDAKDVADEITAAANTQGATFLFGVDDKTRTVTGIPLDKLEIAEAWVRNICNDSVRPAVLATIRKVPARDAQGVERCVLRVDVPKSLFVHEGPHGYFYRIGSSKRKMPPGALPNSLTLDEIGERQFARNELVCTCLSRCPLAERYVNVLRSRIMDRRGEGVPVIFSATKKLSETKPEYKLIDDSELRLTIYPVPIDDREKLISIVRRLSTQGNAGVQTLTNMDAPETLERIAVLLRRNPQMTQVELAAALGLSRTSIANWIRKSRGRIRHVGGRSNGHWEVVENA